MTLARTRRSSLVISVVVLVAAIGLLTTLTATPGSAATLPSGSTPAQYGVNVYVTDNCQSAAVWQTYATNEMKGIKSLGANAVAIAFPFYTAGINANSVFTADQCNGAEQSPSPTRIGVLVHSAQLEGLHVLLRPLLNQSSLGNTWRGELQPTNRPDWFNSYSSMMAPYLRMAQTDKVTSFTISLELASLYLGHRMVVSHLTSSESVQGPARLRDELEGEPQQRCRRSTHGHLGRYRRLSGPPLQLHGQLFGDQTGFGVEHVPRTTSLRNCRQQGHDRRGRHRCHGRRLPNPL